MNNAGRVNIRFRSGQAHLALEISHCNDAQADGDLAAFVFIGGKLE